MTSPASDTAFSWNASLCDAAGASAMKSVKFRYVLAKSSQLPPLESRLRPRARGVRQSFPATTINGSPSHKEDDAMAIQANTAIL